MTDDFPKSFVMGLRGLSVPFVTVIDDPIHLQVLGRTYLLITYSPLTALFP